MSNNTAQNVISSDKEIHTTYYYWGWRIIMIGVIFFALFLIDYNTKQLYKYGSVADLAAIIASTTGICFSMAGLFFVLDNLRLQRETLNLQKKELSNQIAEMKMSNKHFDKQNDSLLNQQYQTTFFHILNTHADRVETLKFGYNYGYNGLAEYYTAIKSNLDIYVQSVNSGVFLRYEETELNPVYKFEKDKDYWEAYLQNIITLLQFLDKRLNETLFYELFYNNLSIEEKFFIGLYSDCFNNSITQYFTGCKFDFKKYYDSQENKYHLEASNYFPQLNIYFRGFHNEFIESDLKENKIDFPFSVDKTIDLFNLKLKSTLVKIHIIGTADDSQPYQNDIPAKDIPIKEEQTGLEIDLSKYFTEGLQNCGYGKFKIHMTLVFSYNSKPFAVKYQFHIEILEVKNPNEQAIKKFFINS